MSRIACLCWLAGLLILGLPPAAAQTRPGLVGFQRVALPDDVPAHLGTALAQDAQGFLWIGTQDGLVRYDGYGFRVFRPRPGDASSLSGSYVRALHVARDGRLWIGTMSGGLSVYDPSTDSFRQFRHRAGDAASLAHDRVEAIAEDRDGHLWLATDDGLDRLDPATGGASGRRAGAQRAAHAAVRPRRPALGGQPQRPAAMARRGRGFRQRGR